METALKDPASLESVQFANINAPVQAFAVDSGSNTGLIVGVVFAVLIIVAIIVVVILVVVRLRKRKYDEDDSRFAPVTDYSSLVENDDMK